MQTAARDASFSPENSSELNFPKAMLFEFRHASNRLLGVGALATITGADITAHERPALVRAFSSEVETGSREKNAKKQKARAPALIPSKPERL
jgi:hypothetical protein